MTRNNFTISFLNLFFSLLILVSCGEAEKSKQPGMAAEPVKTTTADKDSIVQKGNVTTTISTDLAELEKLLDLRMYKPTRVKYKYIFIDNSGQDKRLAVPGPSDDYLEALVYFDSATFEKIMKFSLSADYASPKCEKEEFKFDWLDKEILAEIDNSKKDYYGHPDLLFGSTTAKCWYLNKKILIKKSSG